MLYFSFFLFGLWFHTRRTGRHSLVINPLLVSAWKECTPMIKSCVLCFPLSAYSKLPAGRLVIERKFSDEAHLRCAGYDHIRGRWSLVLHTSWFTGYDSCAY
ncbi:hypothetical protein BDV34DRAFT_30411 [Aspergillus parasiticus]|uniref:Uncharacterized protein n=1 Tax=Aspergillus parasiticus TaxID=5067 RepID=A0A5N6DUY8_ASPPA|nr:hypothetical protein BDV34DRAFT_30411 [Aspergillus parasiticus]